MERKSSKEYSIVFLVEGEKFHFRNLPSTSSLSRCSAANWVGTSLEIAAFGTGADAKYSRATVCLLVFSVHDHGFCGSPNTFFSGKTPT